MKKIIFLVFLFFTINAIFNKERLTLKYKKLYDDHVKNFEYPKQQIQQKNSLFSNPSSKISGEEQVELSREALKALVNLDINAFSTLFCNSTDTIYSNGHQVTNYTTGMGPVRDSDGDTDEGFGALLIGHSSILATLSFLKGLAKYESQCLCGEAKVYGDSLSKSNFGSPVYTASDVSYRVGGARMFLCGLLKPVLYYLIIGNI